MSFVSAVLIAAGESSRMGRPKPLLPWHGMPLIEYQIANLIDSGVSDVVVVVGHQHDSVIPHIAAHGVRHVLNLNYREGKTSSIKAGIHSLALRTTSILLLAVDQPRPSGIIQKVVNSHLNNDALITSPRCAGKGGHPLVFSSALRTELESITEEGHGVREVLLKHDAEIHQVQINDPIIKLDINTPKSYNEAVKRYRTRSTNN